MARITNETPTAHNDERGQSYAKTNGLRDCDAQAVWQCGCCGASHPDGYVRYEHIGTLATWFDGPVAPRRRMPPLVKGFVSARRQVSLMSPTRITIIGAIVNMVLATMKIGTSPCQNTGPILPG